MSTSVALMMDMTKATTKVAMKVIKTGSQMAPERVAMTTVSEVYFLVRVGSWDEDDLESYIQERAEELNQEHYDDGFKSGLEEGVETGRELMYKEAVEAVKCLM